MKKLTKIVASLVLALSIAACGNSAESKVKATVINNAGKSQKMTALEIIKDYSPKKYKGAKVTVTGTVEKIDGNLLVLNEGFVIDVTGKENTISTFKENVKVKIQAYVTKVDTKSNDVYLGATPEHSIMVSRLS